MKRIGYYHVFPFQAIEQGSEIIIWGMGEVGHHYLKQLQMTGYCQVAYAVDNNWKRMEKEPVQVFHPSHIKATPGITVVIANGDAKVAGTIRSTLQGWGMKDENIIWKDYIVGQNMVVEGDEISAAQAGKADDLQEGILRKPYLQGSESARAKRRTPYSIAREFFRGGKYYYDVMVFDIFGTSVFFPFVDMTDLYRLIEQRNGIRGFAELREKAGERARKISAVRWNREEASLEEIYEELQTVTGCDPQEGIRLEEEILLEYCFANSYMFDAYRLFRNKGRKIIFVTDSCYRKEFLGLLLRQCGYDQWDNIFSAGDWGYSMDTGRLYREICQAMGNQLNYYIAGNNGKLHSIIPRKNGFQQASTYFDVNALGNPYRANANGMSKLVGSFYGGLVNIKLYRNNYGEIYDVPYEFGFTYGGILVLGFMKWVREKIQAYDIEKAVFLSGGGDICFKVFEMLNPEISQIRLPWSDVMTVKIQALNEGYPALRRYLERLRKKRIRYRAEDLIELFSFPMTDTQKLRYHIYPKTMLDDMMITQIESFAHMHWAEIANSFMKEMEIARGYIKSYLSDVSTVALVDTSIEMHQARTLAEWVKTWYPGINMICLSIGSFDEEGSLREQSYLFSSDREQGHYQHCRYGNKGETEEYLSYLMPSLEPDLIGFQRDASGKVNFVFEGNPVWDVMDRESIREIQRGILDFADMWLMHQGKAKMKISGADAYIPFKTVSSYMESFIGAM